jgi:predicted metal-dependent hydrolase
MLDDGGREPGGHSAAKGQVVSEEYPEQYRAGLRLFNDEEFFDCHDVLEELWSELEGPGKKYVQGLIQAAIALFHFGNENFGGAKKLYISARKNLDPYGDEYMGVELGRFLTDFQACFQELLDNQEDYPTTVSLRDELVPKIHVSDEVLKSEI